MIISAVNGTIRSRSCSPHTSYTCTQAMFFTLVSLEQLWQSAYMFSTRYMAVSRVFLMDDEVVMGREKDEDSSWSGLVL